MDQLTLKPRKAVVEEPMESWDDDDLDIGGDDFTFRSASLATTANSQHRDSISSRLSIRSDFDSNQGDEERQVLLPGDDERSTFDAIAAATKAGIPIPQNVPSSALMGGTIKRLGGRKLKKIIQDDWDDGDFSELPVEGGLKIKQHDANFPDALRQVSGGSSNASPVMLSLPKLQPSSHPRSSPNPGLRQRPAQSDLLNKYKDEDDDDFFGGAGDTIKVAKSRQVPKLLPLITPPTPQRNQKTNEDDDFEHDFQFPSSGEPLRLSARKEIPKTPASAQDDFEWGEGSLGTRHGGTRRDGRSNRSSSASALSPSVASSITAESEDDGLDGLVLPSGPLRFDDILKRRQQERSPERQPLETLVENKAENKDDFLSGLEFGDGDVFDSSKLTLNRNIKVKTTRQTSPVRPKTAVSLTFTNKPTPAPSNSRLPRPLGGHERAASSLEPVSESGGPIINRVRRPASRLGGHSAQSSINSISTPQTPTSIHSNAPSTPRRRDLAAKSSNSTLRNEPTTTNSQLLKIKRSMPTMKTYPQSPAKPLVSRYERPSSRSEGNRPGTIRPKTPVDRDRSGAESSMSHARKNPVPFLPAGSSSSTSHHVVAKTSRHFRRHDSESSNASIELRPASRTVSRSMMRSPSPRRYGHEALGRDAAAKRTMTKPVRRRHFGDGFELDGFDDLPTSRESEQKYTKEPVGRGPPKLNTLRRVQETLPARGTTPAPYSPSRTNELPRFARDTNASRMAREHSLAQRAPSAQGAPLATLTNQWKAKVSATTGLSAANTPTLRSKKSRGPPQKPQLIKPMGNLNNPKSIKGMYYNPHTFRWEGNENDLTPFDAPTSSPLPAHKELHQQPSFSHLREKENTTPRPALIQNVNSSMNVQVVGGMVFDPQRMCWLKMPASQSSQRSASKNSEMGDTMDGFDAFDDEEDVFKDVPDLEDKVEKGEEGDKISGRKSDAGSKLQDEWLVGEEFDVGPEFVRRQREEEDRWRRKCEKWVSGSISKRGGEEWRWSIRDVVNE